MKAALPRLFRNAAPMGTGASAAAARTRHPSPSGGVALVITLILIAVITFLAITFLALARRERGQVTVTVEQTTAKLAADTAYERALAELQATILSSTNAFNFDLLVSTNFINRAGYDPGAVDPRTNVNFDYTIANAALAGNQPLENLSHLLYNPRPPVYITNKIYGSNEFRFYLDLNRDRQYTRNGWEIITNENGGFYDLNGKSILPFRVDPNQPLPNNVLVRSFTGDPEWIGLLLRPEFPHSASNQFLSRYAFIVVPAGKTLDVNYIHNATRLTRGADLSGGDLFRRNQGVASYEINLAGFLVDLNTNAWPGPYQLANALGAPYVYNPDPEDLPNQGSAFDDAVGFMRYRYGNNRALWPGYSFRNTYPLSPAQAMWRDGVDAYALSPLMSNIFGLTSDYDNVNTARTPWGGSEKPNHLWTTQDFFDQSKLPANFTNRLGGATRFSPSQYDSYTFYRLLSQLGTDSAPEPDTKLNVNYVNVGGLRSTNFVSWTNETAIQATFGPPPAGSTRQAARIFFSNAVDRLVRKFSTEWRDGSFVTYTNAFRTNQPFGANRIPVLVGGKFVYSSSLHRQLQLAANIWDGLHGQSDNFGPYPTVFRPRFVREGNDVYINDFVEVRDYPQLIAQTSGRFRDLSFTNDVQALQPDDLVLGVPLVLGARKGLPNFNEFSAEAVVQITRKLELVKSAPGGGNTIVQTNQMFVIGISNTFGAEFWNSYSANYARPVDIAVTNFSILALTNDYGFTHSSNFLAGAQPPTIVNWARWRPSLGIKDPNSLLVPLRTNHVILPDLAYRFSGNRFDTRTLDFERPSGNAFPRWGLAITNRVIAIVKDRASGRIIDYVQLNAMVGYQDLSLYLAQPHNGIGFAGVWGTNVAASGNARLTGLPGIIQQIAISRGEVEMGGNWQNHGIGQLAGQTRDQAIANFLAFFEPSHLYTYQPGGGASFLGTNFNLTATAPFTPTRKWSVPMIWQANDPLVHYTAGDLEYLERSGVAVAWTPPTANTNTLENLGSVNKRYKPWGGNKFAGAEDDKLKFQMAVKDPGMRSSDGWQFPTNNLPGIGWLGRLHRGTPWQTVYLKSTRVVDAVRANAMKANDWRNWTGNRQFWANPQTPGSFLNDADLTQPELDRGLLDLFTTALNENATRGQLPINQSGLAAWSAVFSGIVALTNTATDQDVIDNFDQTSATPPVAGPLIIDPAGYYDEAATNSWPAVVKLAAGINRTRADTNQFALRTFTRLGDLLATPELTEQSPFLNRSQTQIEQGLNDQMVEWLPQQMLSLVRLGEQRFVIYSFGQTLKPAARSIQLSGAYSQLCTNYQITAEVATRAVVKVVGSPDPRQTGHTDPELNYPPRLVVESFNVLPPD